MFIALTGGIGCGKSAALEMFAKCGFICDDADKICHGFYARSEGIEAICRRWPQALDKSGNVDRKVLANIVFRDDEALAYLENLIRPYLQQKLAEYRKNTALTMIEVPLLFEKNMQHEFDKTISVWSPFYLRRERLAKRNWDHAECSRRERLQWSSEQKLAAADYGIINSGSLEMLFWQCRLLTDKIIEQTKN